MNDSSFEKKLNPLHPTMLCAKFGWNLPSGSREEDFLILSMYFRYFVIISPCKGVRPFYFNKLESPLLKNALCQVWLKLAQCFWRRRWKSEKFTAMSTTTTTTTDNRQILIRKIHLSLRLRWAKKWECLKTVTSISKLI